MSTSSILIVAGAFLASAVEMVEALTIVLGVGVVRGWRSTLIGAGAAGIVLALLVAVLGPALGAIPIGTLRLVVGALLLAFGLQWLRKAILRSSGYKDLHDEDEAFRQGRAQAEAAGSEQRAGLDWYSFTVAFKGVLLEGLEVVFIVIAFGSAQGHLALAAAGAAAAFVVVVVAGVLGQGAALARPGEHDQVRGRTATHQLRQLLGRRGGGCRLAGRRALAARRDRVLRRRVARARASPPAETARDASPSRC